MALRVSGSSSTGRSSSGSARTSASGYNRPIKLVCVGDGTVGKTCMFENYAGNQDLDGNVINLTLWDTAGQEDYERLRPLSYPGADAFLLCYSVDNVHSYQNILSKWQPEVKHHCPKAPYVVVATKLDLRPETEPQSARVNISKSITNLTWNSKGSSSVSGSGGDKKEPKEGKDEEKVFVTKDMGRRLAAKIKASKYVECSAKSMLGIEDVIVEGIRAALNPTRVERVSKCTLL